MSPVWRVEASNSRVRLPRLKPRGRAECARLDGVRIEDYALIGDTQTAALVVRSTGRSTGCASPASIRAPASRRCSATEHMARGRSRPPATSTSATRRYRPDTLVLETTFTTPDGAVRLVDCMPVRGEAPDVVRVVEGVSGSRSTCAWSS